MYPTRLTGIRRLDLDKITDELEREATVGIIHNCAPPSSRETRKFILITYPSSVGQTPKKLFQSPHPQRIMQGTYTLPLILQRGIVEDYRLLEQNRKTSKGVYTERTALF
jgi:hypothetical protein